LALASFAVAAAAAAFSTAQRVLSTPARHVRRRAPGATAAVDGVTWDEATLLATWEQPLRALALGHVLLAVGLLLAHIAP
jgi:hypothetical protein